MTPKPAHIVAIVLATADGSLILQQRDNGPLGAPHLRNRLSFFGGHGEPGEPAQDAIIREIFEELELKLEPAQLSLLGVFQKQPAVHGDNNFVNVFRYQMPVDPATFVVHEGAGYRLVDRDNPNLPSLTPFARQLVNYCFDTGFELDLYRVTDS